MAKYTDKEKVNNGTFHMAMIFFAMMMIAVIFGVDWSIWVGLAGLLVIEMRKAGHKAGWHKELD